MRKPEQPLIITLSCDITHPKKVQCQPDHQGVALIVVNKLEENKVLLIQQGDNEPKFGRRKGQWNIITETWREEDNIVYRNVERAVEEELGKGMDSFSFIPGTYREAREQQNGCHFLFRCFGLRYEGLEGDPNIIFRARYRGEIQKYAWTSFDRLDKYDIELGARMVLYSYCPLLQTVSPDVRSVANEVILFQNWSEQAEIHR